MRRGLCATVLRIHLTLESNCVCPLPGCLSEGCWSPERNSARIPAEPTTDELCYTEERMAKAVDGIRQVHLALIEHNDPYPKNIAIVPGEPERVMWIDFDVAITYPDGTHIGDRERGWIEFETKCVESVGRKLVSAPMIIGALFPCR
jgi:hypothetical protein